jgi:hypothetical protein
MDMAIHVKSVMIKVVMEQVFRVLQFSTVCKQSTDASNQLSEMYYRLHQPAQHRNCISPQHGHHQQDFFWGEGGVEAKNMLTNLCVSSFSSIVIFLK